MSTSSLTNQLLAPDAIQLSVRTAQNGVVFLVTPQGEIERDGKQITDDDAAVADALREFLYTTYNVKVRPANRGQK